MQKGKKKIIGVTKNQNRDYNQIRRYTHGLIKLYTLWVKYYNDSLGSQKSERDMDEVTFFYVMLLQWKVEPFFPEISAEIFSWKLAYLVSRCIKKGPLT